MRIALLISALIFFIASIWHGQPVLFVIGAVAYALEVFWKDEQNPKGPL